MFQSDPIHHIENVLKNTHDSTSKYTQPVLRRYPLLFAFTFTFSVAAVLHGFELWADQIEFFHTHPFALIWIGIVALFLTGTLYKALGNEK